MHFVLLFQGVTSFELQNIHTSYKGIDSTSSMERGC